MRQGAIKQGELFGECEMPFPVQLSLQAKQEVKRLLVLWMQSVAASINKETDDEQDPR